ncbi:amino acid adenylation domain-containing protein [Kordia sp.]|uniref:non-ribosomal peptide synthetase n=1 Tax=Kordia sp. TaxID=1965332 RepID=UPI003D6A4FE6
MVQTILHTLKTLNVKIDVVDERLDVKAPKGALTPTLIEDIKSHKQALIDFIKEHKAVSADTYEMIQPVEKQVHYPLSSAQRRLWILSQFEKESIAYNMPQYREFSEDINIENFEKAIFQTIERHEILRTVFGESETGEVRQFIRTIDELNFTIDHQDYSTLSNKKEVAAYYINTDAAKPFDLKNGPLLRIAILKMAKNKSIFYFNMHHIICDGWSMNVLTNDVTHFYQALQTEITPMLDPLEIQYKDFANWQQEGLESNQQKAAANYWKQQFLGELPVLELPTQKKRPLLKTSSGKTFITYIDAATTKALKSFSTKHEGSLFMGLLTAMNTLFYRYTSQDDFIIGSPSAGREHVQLENQIGFYLNTIALRNKVAATDSFSSLFSKVRNTTFNAYKHQQYPFDQLVEELKLKRDNSRNPIFDVMLLLQNFNENTTEVTIENPEEIKIQGTGFCKYDFLFTFQEIGEYLSMEVNFNTDVYEDELIHDFIKHFKNVLSEALKAPETAIGKLAFISKEEKSTLLNTFNATNTSDVASMKTLVESFEAQAKKTPNNIAIEYENKTYTYQQLNQLSNQFARFIQETYDIKTGDIVGIRLERSGAYLVYLLGILKTRACCAPINSKIPLEKLAHITKNTSCVLTETELEKFYSEQSKFDTANLNETYSLDDLAYIVYTSGSTGVPKGCMLQHKGIVNHIHSKIELLELDKNTTICHTSKMYFVGGIWQLWTPLFLGGKVLLTTMSELQNIPSLIDKAVANKVDVLEVIPSQLNALFAIKEETKLKAFRKIILTGEKLTVSYVNKFFDIHPTIELINTYGQSECSDVTTYFQMNSKIEQGKIQIGKPIRNTKMYVLDDNKELCPIGVVGELCTSGVGVSPGYLNQPELTAKSFVANPIHTEERLYKTGDLGRWLPDGNLEILGRKDHQISIRGYRIEMGEIESTLQKYENVRRAVVQAKELKEGETSLIAYLETNETFSLPELRSYLKARLQEYMLPSYFIVLDELPLTPNGKIDKKSLPHPSTVTLQTGNTFIAPKTAVEKQVVAIVKEILEVDKVSVKDGFYDLGGDSIKLIQLLHELKKRGYNIRPELVLQATDIEEIATELEKVGITNITNDTANFCIDITADTLIEISENQKHMMHYKDSQAIVGPFVLPQDVDEILVQEVEYFLNYFPELHIEFIEKDGKIYQRKSTDKTVKIDTVFKQANITNDVLETWQEEISLQEFDIINEAPIRLHILKDSTSGRTWFCLAISHVLADLHTALVMHEVLNTYIFKRTIGKKEEAYSSLHYAKWQQQFLETDTAKVSRDFWTTFLTGNTTKITNKETENEAAYASETYTILDADFNEIKAYANRIKVPISVVFMAYHEYVMEQLYEENIPMQLMLVNGRERETNGFDSSKVLGVINNVLPMPLRKNKNSSFSERCLDMQLKYIKARQHQGIPYETIRTDFIEKSSVDIDLLPKSVVNFQQLPGTFTELNNQLVQRKIIRMNRNLNFDITCRTKQNGVQIELLSTLSKLEKLKNAALTPKDILKFSI